MNMAEPQPYEDLVLGSGAGGKLLAWHLAGSGRRVAVVERRYVGGSCPNINCLPSKNEIWSAKVADLLHHAAQFGIVTGSVAVDMAKVRQRKREMVEGLIALHLELYQKSGAELIVGEGRFVAPKTLEVRLRDGGTRVLTGERIFLNLGTRPTIPATPGLADARPLTNIEALELDRLPAHLIVFGGGYVGLEFAQAYRRFGSRVTVIQHGPQLLGQEDADVADALARLFADEGIEVLLSAETLQVEGRSGESVRLRVRTPQGERRLEGSDILVATGRTPNTAGIGLDTLGVRLDERGYVQVNDRLETTSPDVWAIGECAGSPQFTHVSEDDFRIIRDNLAPLTLPSPPSDGGEGRVRGESRSTRDRLIPSCLFTDPQLARVGLNEVEARRRGVAVRVAKLPMAAVLRTRTTGEMRGFMKALVDARSDRILGFTMFGPEAGEVMAVVQTAMLAGMPYTGLRDAILAHPTMAEGLNGLFSQVQPSSAK
jgi:pyruvate/2-oxoglutarate dehydrogenase complex dihydrolipoamide dehydrogenase (E3) component